MSNEIIIFGGGARGLYFTQMLTQQLGRRVAAIVDNYEPGHEAIRRRTVEFGTPDTRIYSSTAEALAAIPRSQADIAFIMTPEWTHLDIFRQIVKSGFNIFLEKPLATTVNDVLEIQDLAAATEKTVQVGFVLRYSAFYKKIKEIVNSGKLGKVIVIGMNERLGLRGGATFKRSWHRKLEYTGGFINEKCAHDLDLMCWFKEEHAAPVSVYSYGGTHFCPPRNTPMFCTDCSLKDCRWRYVGVETLKSINGLAVLDNTSSFGKDRCVFHSDADVTDHQCVNVVFDDGSQGLFTAISMSANPGRDIMIHGTDGYLDGNMETGQLRMCNYWNGGMETIDIGSLDGHGGGDEAIVGGFLDSVDSGLAPLATVEAGVRASMIAFAADESIRERGVVSLSKMLSGAQLVS